MWRFWVSVCSLVALLLSYRVYVIVHRDVPAQLEHPNLIRVLDEIGRIGNDIAWVCHQLGVEPATWPAKTLVNFGIRLLLNGIGTNISNITVVWQRVYKPRTCILLTFELAKIRYTSIDKVPVTIFQPDTLTPADQYPTMVYFHGGGWTWLSVDIYSGYLANIASKTRLQIVAVRYRLSPRNPFPAAYDDCLAATGGLLRRMNQFKVLPGKVIIAGDGAGGNLAAAVSHMNNIKGKILLQVLINPALQMLDFETPSYQDNANTLPGVTSAYRNGHHWLSYAGITKDYLQLVLQNVHVFKKIRNSHFSSYVNSKEYLPAHHGVTDCETKPHVGSNFIVASAFENIITDPRFSPMMAEDLRGLPSVYMITSQYDVYRDEGIMYTNRLAEAGVKVKLEHYKDGFHGFFIFNSNGPLKFNVSQRALDNFVEFVDTTVHQGT